MRGTREKGFIISFKILPKLNSKERAKLFRKVYGYLDKSQYGRYEYKRDGLLEKIGYIKVIRGVFIIRKDSLNKVKTFLRGKAKLIVREIKLTRGDIKKLKLARNKEQEVKTK